MSEACSLEPRHVTILLPFRDDSEPGSRTQANLCGPGTARSLIGCATGWQYDKPRDGRIGPAAVSNRPLGRTPMWGMHGPGGRRGGALVRSTRVRSGWPTVHDDRGAGAQWHTPGAASLDRRRCRAVRLLPVRSDHDRGCSAESQREPHGRGHRCGVCRKHLPLRHVSAHPGCGSSGRWAGPRARRSWRPSRSSPQRAVAAEPNAGREFQPPRASASLRMSAKPAELKFHDPTSLNILRASSACFAPSRASAK